MRFVADLLDRCPDDGNPVDALLFLRNGAAYEQFGPIQGPFDARSTETEFVGRRQRLRFAGGHQAQMQAFKIAEEKVLAVGRDGTQRNRIFRRIRRQDLRLEIGLRVRAVMQEPTAEVSERRGSKNDDCGRNSYDRSAL